MNIRFIKFEISKINNEFAIIDSYNNNIISFLIYDCDENIVNNKYNTYILMNY